MKAILESRSSFIKSAYYRIFDDYKVNANETWIIFGGMDLFYGKARLF